MGVGFGVGTGVGSGVAVGVGSGSSAAAPQPVNSITAMQSSTSSAVFPVRFLLIFLSSLIYQFFAGVCIRSNIWLFLSITDFLKMSIKLYIY